MHTPLNTHVLSKLGTLRQVEIFLTVADCGSIARAAEQLHLTQPTVSMQLKKLAEAIGLPLYEVMGKKLMLTEVGREVVSAGRDIFATIHRLNDRINDIKGLQAGTLKIAVVSTAKYFLYHILSPFCQQYPGIDIEFHVGNRQQIIERMEHNQDDLYILAETPTHLDIVQHPFLPNPLCVIAAKDHPLAGQMLSWKDIAQERFVLREEGSGTLRSIEQFFARQGWAMPRAMTIQSNEAIKYAILSNMGLSILSAYILFDNKQLTQLKVKKFPIMSHWHVVHRQDKRLSLVADHFLQFMLEQGKTLLPMQRIQANIEAANSGQW